MVKFVRFWSKLVLDAAAGSLNLARNLLMASKLRQDGPKIAPRWSKKGQAHMSPNEAHDRTKQAQDGPKMRPGGPKMAPGRHKMDARWLPEASRGAQTGPRWSQKEPKWRSSGVPTGKAAAYKSVKFLRGFT